MSKKEEDSKAEETQQPQQQKVEFRGVRIYMSPEGDRPQFQFIGVNKNEAYAGVEILHRMLLKEFGLGD